jgi:DNA-binding GntR family transcriptional regulator
MADIRSGRIAVGERMPGELELVDVHGVSRHTVRASLKVLEELGLIERHQGLGTVVKAKRSAPTYVQHVQSPSELMQYPSDSRLKVVSVENIKASRALARILKCRSGTQWTRIDAIRRLRGSQLPICWSSIYVRPEYADITHKIGRSSVPVYELLERTFDERIESVEVDFRAGSVSEQMAERLGVDAGSPSLTLVRRYVGRGKRQIEISVSEHPADSFNYTLTLRRGWQSGSGWSEG